MRQNIFSFARYHQKHFLNIFFQNFGFQNFGKKNIFLGTPKLWTFLYRWHAHTHTHTTAVKIRVPKTDKFLRYFFPKKSPKKYFRNVDGDISATKKYLAFKFSLKRSYKHNIYDSPAIPYFWTRHRVEKYWILIGCEKKHKQKQNNQRKSAKKRKTSQRNEFFFHIKCWKHVFLEFLGDLEVVFFLDIFSQNFQFFSRFFFFFFLISHLFD